MHASNPSRALTRLWAVKLISLCLCFQGILQGATDIRFEFVFPTEPDASTARSQLTRLTIANGAVAFGPYWFQYGKSTLEGAKLVSTVTINEGFKIGESRLLVEESVAGFHLCLKQEVAQEGEVLVARYKAIPITKLQFLPTPHLNVREVTFDCRLCDQDHHAVESVQKESAKLTYNSSHLQYHSDVRLVFTVALTKGEESFILPIRPEYLVQPLNIEALQIAAYVDIPPPRVMSTIAMRVIDQRRRDTLQQLTEMQFKAVIRLVR